jgi:hypothetical protein
MGFAVAHEGGTKDQEYQTYVRLLSRKLLKSGVALENLPRVRDDGTADSWLYVWDDEADASAFANELKKQTGDRKWFVRPVRARPSLGPLRPLEISVGRQRDGWTFALEPFTRRTIQTKFPESCRRRSVFIGFENDKDGMKGDLEQLARQVLSILTGLGPEQLMTLGMVRAVDPVDGKKLVPAFPIAVVLNGG